MRTQSESELLAKYGLDGFRRRHPWKRPTITLSDLMRGCRAYEAQEPRDSMYRVASFLVQEWWGDPTKLVDALSVVLLTWNASFYRFGGGLDSAAFEKCLRDKWTIIEAFHNREFASFGSEDQAEVSALFSALSSSLRLATKQRESPVSCAKALHLLAPRFFSIWDQYIAPAYSCPYAGEFPSVAYIVFCERMREIGAALDEEMARSGSPLDKEWFLKKTLLKRIDEYNFITITLPELRRQQEKRQSRKKG